MAFQLLTSESAGAPILNGQNGSLVALLDWALPQAGWSILFSSGNARVYESVNGRLLHVNHDSSVSGSQNMATVRGCEGATSATDLVDPYPTIAQLANNASVWGLADGANTNSRYWRIYIRDDFFSLHVVPAQTYGGLGLSPDGISYKSGGFFGETLTEFADTYNSVIWVRGSSNSNVQTGNQFHSLGVTTQVRGDATLYWQRSVDGSVKSSRGNISASGTSNSNVPGTPAPMAGFANRIYREPVALNDAATSSTAATPTPGPMALVRRGYIPGFWSLVHIHAGTLDDTMPFEDTAYNPAAIFRPLVYAGNGAAWIMEETDTWNPY